MLASRAEVLALKPDYPALLGVASRRGRPLDRGRRQGCAISRCAPSSPRRATEDPVTGSLNAGLAQWLIGAGLAPTSYIASQGTALGRAGRVHVQRDGDDIWIGGSTVTCIDGKIDLTGAG